MSYKSFEFSRDNYQAPIYNADDFEVEEERSPPRQAWSEPAPQERQRPKTPSGTGNRSKRSSSRGRRSPVTEKSISKRKGAEEGPITLSNLHPEERERYLDFMMHHEFEFQLDESGEYVATFRHEPKPEPKPAPTQKKPVRQPSPAKRNDVQPRTQTRQERPSGPQPRPLSWLLRMIADIYDSRFVLYSTEILTARDISDFESFSSFIFNFLAKKFGLEKLKIQMSKELLMSVAAHRGSSPEVELFGVFLSGQYDAAALLFYLFCRWKVLPECARGIKTEGRYHLQYIPANRFVALTKTLLAKQPPAMYSEFMKLLEHTYGRRGDRKIEVHQYLLLLLQTFIGFTRGNRPAGDEGGEDSFGFQDFKDRLDELEQESGN